MGVLFRRSLGCCSSDLASSDPSAPACRERLGRDRNAEALCNRTVALGMVAEMLSFMGQFALFTYLRPFLEQVTGISISILTWMLLIVGLTGLIGTSFVSRFLDGRSGH